MQQYLWLTNSRDFMHMTDADRRMCKVCGDKSMFCKNCRPQSEVSAWAKTYPRHRAVLKYHLFQPAAADRYDNGFLVYMYIYMLSVDFSLKTLIYLLTAAG